MKTSTSVPKRSHLSKRHRPAPPVDGAPPTSISQHQHRQRHPTR
ncbi:hypothetical protein ABGB07_04505 [Micromonosporaceae bacterium B7E4]